MAKEMPNPRARVEPNRVNQPASPTVENGKIIEQWGGPDLFDMLKQLGAEITTGSR